MQSCWSPFLKIRITFAVFKISGKVPVSKPKLTRQVRGTYNCFWDVFSVLIGRLFGPEALFSWRLLIIFFLFLWCLLVQWRRAFRSFWFFRKFSKLLWVGGILFFSFCAIHVKKVLKWLAMSFSFVVRALPIRAIHC